MWDSEFNISMIQPGERYIINCPTEELERELASALDGMGLHYPDGEHLSNRRHWEEYREEFCYFIYEDAMVRRGPRPSGSDRDGINYTFYGDNAPDFEAASDDELMALLGM